MWTLINAGLAIGVILFAWFVVMDICAALAGKNIRE